MINFDSTKLVNNCSTSETDIFKLLSIVNLTISSRTMISDLCSAKYVNNFVRLIDPVAAVALD